ncbi:MAG: hypothetical protein ACXU9C_30940 [Xanthobacteraceae bacterium]
MLLTLARQSETLQPENRSMMGAMMRIGAAAILVVLAGVFSLPASAQEALPQGLRGAPAAQPAATDISAQQRVRRPPTRLRVQPYYDYNPNDVYPRYYPGRNAVRDCNATYVQEFRPSGTVIVPRMNCFWRPG